MANAYEIPLTGVNQTESITLSGVQYRITVQYRNVVNGGWVLNIDDQFGNSIVDGIAMVTGVDLLHQYKHLGFVGNLVLVSDVDPDAVPAYGQLGVTSHLWYIV